MSIASEISRLQQAKADIKSAIEAKGVTVPSNVLIDTYDDYVAQISGGVTPTLPVAGAKDVNFIDYDGTIRYSYTASEFANLTAMPENPFHTGLIAQGWNYTLSDAKTYVATYKRMVIGQMYVTSDGKTKLYTNLVQSDRLEQPLYYYQTDANGVSVDWGDGSTAESSSSTGSISLTHTYAAAGSYVIELTVVSGSLKLGTGGYQISIFGSSSTEGDDNVERISRLMKVEIGSGVTEILAYAFIGCRSLRYVTMPHSIVSIANNAFSSNNKMEGIVIPDQVTSFGSNVCGSGSIKVISLPGNLNTIDRVCNSNVGSTLIHIPSNITTINGSTFSSSYGLTSIHIPTSVTKIEANAFSYCRGLKAIYMYRTTPPTLSSTNAFNNVATDFVIYVPSSAVSTYKGASNWSSYSSIIQAKP